MKSVFILILAQLLSVQSYTAQNINKITPSNKKSNIQQIKPNLQIDTIIVRDTVIMKNGNSFDSINSYYLSILEKTNSQLGLWTNPYGILIAILAVLFTIMTIIAAVIIYRQGKEYKQRQENIQHDYDKRLEEFLNEKKEQIQITEQSFKKIIDEYTEKLEKVEGDKKSEIKKTIDELNEYKNEIQTNITSSVPVISRNFHRCSKCGYGFEIIDDNAYNSQYIYAFQKPFLFSGSGKNERTVKCSKCGNLDKI